MPTYEYECGRCAHAFERFQSMTDEPLKRCPKCKGKVRRIIGTGAGLLFKGSGFYITDYRTEGYQKDRKADSSADAGGKKDAAEKTPASDAVPAKTKPEKTKPVASKSDPASS